MIPVPDDSADWGDTLQDLEFLALTDSTFQYMLAGDQYGARSLFGGQALICPGAALTQNYKRPGSITPSILELLSWQCLHICGHCPDGVPYFNSAVVGMLKDNLHKKVNVALIPIEDSIPEDCQVHYDWIGGARAAYSLDLWELADQRIMTLGPLVPAQLYGSKDKLHFHAASAEAAIGALTIRALRAMTSSKPEAFPVLLVCSWNVRLPNAHREMLATRELCLAETVGDLLAAALRASRSMWSLRYSFGEISEDQPFPQGVMQTYMHDSKPEPSQMCRRHMPEMTRTFCDDEDIRQTLLDHAGKYSKDLSNVLQSPAHRADLFRYVYLYEHGGLYLDIKCSLRMQFDELRSCLAEEWGTAQSYAHSALGHCPSPPGQLPKDYMVMAIGNRGDHIFHGIIYCRPRHPLVVEAIVQFYSPPIFEGAAASDYLIFCKYLYRVLREKLGHPPQHGWNISSRFGPIYLLRERHSKDLQAHSEIPTDGHYMVTRLNKIAMFTRCWNWKRGFAGDLAAKARNEAQILRAMPEAASDAAWARSQATSPTSPLPGRCMHLTSVLETPNAAEVVFKPPPPLAHGNSTASLPGLPSSPPKLSLGGDAWDPRPPLCLMPGLVAWLEGFGGQALCWAQLAAIWWPEADGWAGTRPKRELGV